MTITLTVIKSPPGSQLDETQRVFEADGGVIGRGTGNDWILSDPERFLSSKHCQITSEDGQYFLVDLSTNGTFLNGSNEPVGRGNRTPLQTGDQIDVGDYRFKVVVETGGGFAASPFDETDLAHTATDVDILGGDSVAPEAMFMSSEYGGAIGDIAPDELKVTDPLLALDNAADPFASPPERQQAHEIEPFGSQEDSADLLQESAQWPDVKAEEPVLPDDWDQDISILARRKPQNNPPHALADDDSLIAKKPLSEPEPAFVKPKPAAAARPTPARGRNPAPRPAAKPAPQAPPPKPAPATAPRRPASGADTALLDALGLDSSELSGEQIVEINATVGEMMRETLEGLMQILRSRTSIKNEFRMNVTTIQPVENNPIKFSVNVDELLETMFTRKSRAYKEPVEALQESFNSIADHQVAVIAGIRQAFRSAIGQFDPNLLEEEFKQTGKSSMLPGLSGAKYWSAYQDHYQSMVNNMERSFQELFGDEFVQAYEDQLHKLAKARKRGK